MARKKKEVDFEASLTELEGLVSRMEAGDLKLEEALALYVEGMNLSKLCLEKLNSVEEQMVRIVEEQNGLLKEVQIPTLNKE